MTVTIDDQIRAMFAKLEERKASVKALQLQIDAKWLTNLSYVPSGATTPINVGTAQLQGIIDLMTDLVLKQEARKKAAAILGIEVDDKINGFDAADWTKDCKKRIASIKVREEERLLQQLEQRLNSVLSPEQRREIEVKLLLKDLES